MKGINARAWMAQLSTAGRLESESLPQPEQPRTLTVERWNSREWIEVRMVWNGTQYQEEK
jgi:hypothetical protein